MAVRDRARWDQYFRKTSHQPYPEPDSLLLTFTPPPNDDTTALDLAAGLGQNGLWLADQGYAVDIIDISRVALNRARSEMTMRNLRNVNLLQSDIDTYYAEYDRYDVVCMFRYMKRSLFKAVKRTLKPGGRFIFESFNERYLEKVPQFNAEFLLALDELPTFFTDWHIIHFEESGYITQLVVVKPD